MASATAVDHQPLASPVAALRGAPVAVAPAPLSEWLIHLEFELARKEAPCERH